MIEDVPEIIEELEELIGSDAAKTVLNYFAGMSVYFPKGAITFETHNAIRAEFRGNNYTELAQKYGYTPSYVRKIIHTKINPTAQIIAVPESALPPKPMINNTGKDSFETENIIIQGELF